MSVIKSFIIAFSMYSRIPMPRVEWKEKDMRYAICFFPLVGVVTGACVWLWITFCERMGINLVCKSLVAAALPLILTGGIHIDGFMDTSDALHSYQSRERKLEILKDSHIGAFAVIMLAGYFLLLTAALSCIGEKTAFLLGISFFVSRIGSGLSIVYFKNAKKEGMLYSFSSTAHKKTVRLVLILEALACAVLVLGTGSLAGLFMLVIAAAVFGYYRYRSYGEFGGITGDLAGWFLCICELAMAVGLAAAEVVFF